jgi:hypothetical protein
MRGRARRSITETHPLHHFERAIAHPTTDFLEMLNRGRQRKRAGD